MSKNESNEFQHVIPAEPGLVATVIWADDFAGDPEAVVKSYRIIGWGVTENNSASKARRTA